jgi:replicative DNA helicase
MSTNQLVTRVISAVSKIDGKRFRTPHKMSENDVESVIEGIHAAYPYPLHIDDKASTSILEMRAKARRMYSEHKIQIIFVDYLQLMTDKSARSREQEISSISRGLKAIAKDLNIPVVALSQLNRQVEMRITKRPMLSDLRESGAIEQDADVVLFVHRPEMYGEEFLIDKITPSADMAEIIIGKQRNGESGIWLPLQYTKRFTRYENPSFRPDAQQRTETPKESF